AHSIGPIQGGRAVRKNVDALYRCQGKVGYVDEPAFGARARKSPAIHQYESGARAEPAKIDPVAPAQVRTGFHVDKRVFTGAASEHLRKRADDTLSGDETGCVDVGPGDRADPRADLVDRGGLSAAYGYFFQR